LNGSHKPENVRISGNHQRLCVGGCIC